jgi:hypothetical protein
MIVDESAPVKALDVRSPLVSHGAATEQFNQQAL